MERPTAVVRTPRGAWRQPVPVHRLSRVFPTGPVSPPDRPAGFFVLEAFLAARRRLEASGKASRTAGAPPARRRGRDAASRARAHRRGRSGASSARQGRAHEPVRQRQGPSGAGDASRRHRLGPADRRKDDPRGDLRQHRHRRRDARPRARIPRDALSALERVARAPGDPSRVRRRARPDRSARGYRRRHPGGPSRGAAAPVEVLLSGPVLESGQLAGALRDDGSGDLGRYRRPTHALRRGTRHLGDVRRRGALPEGEGRVDPLRLRRARGPAPRPRRY